MGALTQNCDKLIALAAELGCCLMTSGAEIYRTEESVQRLIQAYGAPFCQVFAIPNCITVSLTDPDGRPVTQIRRVPSHGTDIDQLEQYNTLCRRLCRETPPLDEAMAQLAQITRSRRGYPIWVQLFGYFLGCGAFTLFFGGGPVDGLCGGLCGIAIGICLSIMTRARANLFFKTIAGALFSALVAVALTRLRAEGNLDAIIIGALMALVPGIAFTNAMRDLIAGDMVSGISKTAEALLIGTGIALGTALGLWLSGWQAATGTTTQTSMLIPCVCAFIACIGFCLLFNIHGAGMLLCATGGMLGWLVYLLAAPLANSAIVQSFLAALAIAAWSEIMARVRKSPVTSYLLIALFPLVPGGGIYYSMQHAMAGQTQAFLDTLLHTLGVAGALALGVLMVSSAVRLVTSLRQHHR